MLETLVYLLCVCVVIAVVWWVADYLPVPEPLNKLLKVASVVIGIIIFIYALLGIAGMAPNLR